MNAMTVYQLILAKQSQQPFRLARDVSLAMIISIMVIIFATAVSDSKISSLFPIFTVAMLIVAIGEIGSHTFNEYKEKGNAYVWLMLPATTLEKWLSNFVMSFFIIPVVFILVFSASSLIAKLLIAMLGWPVEASLFNPISTDGWSLLKGYWLIHPLYFFGAIYFKNRVVMKTTAAMFILIILWFIYTAFIADLLISAQVESSLEFFESQFNHSETYIKFGPLIIEEENIRLTSPILGRLLGTAIMIGYFSYFWSLSLLRFRELEL
ncbi:hypothetical protein [Reinekea sp.]|jgi:small-conductance mechanosensitive channel|uniref:hypothetical protein n=1 Tax=Reinekea sp. TaxID=1970455 RepID=UPI00398A2550